MAFPFNFFQHIVNDISGRIVGPEGINPLELIDEPSYTISYTGEIEQPKNDRLDYNISLSGDFVPHSKDSGVLYIEFSGEMSYLNDRTLYEVAFSGDLESRAIDFADYSATLTGEVFQALCDRFSYTTAIVSGEVEGYQDKINTSVSFYGRKEPIIKDRLDADMVLVTGYYTYSAAAIRRDVEDSVSAGIFIISGRYYQPAS